MHEKEIEIRWRDMDAFGHVYHSVYLTYLEEARDEFLGNTLSWGENLWDFVIVHISLDYRRELNQSDDRVVASIELAHVGTSSFRTIEQVRTMDGLLAAEGDAVMVARRRSTGTSRALSTRERQALEAQLAL